MQDSGELVLTEAERDVRELEQHVADQHIRVKDLQAAGREDDEMKAREGLFCSPMPWCLRTDVYRLSARHATFNNGSPPAEGWRLSLGGSVACCRRSRHVPQSSRPLALTSRLSRLRLCREGPKGGQAVWKRHEIEVSGRIPR